MGEVKTGRAPSLSIEDRRAMILDAAIPLFLEHGQNVTTRQIADAAGIAEGTVFRAFGDKESVIDAAVARFLDPEPTRAMLRGIDPEQPLRDKLHDVLVFVKSRMTGIMGIMGAVGPRELHRPTESDFVELIAAVIGDDLPRLRVDIAEAAHLIRLVAFSSSIPRFSDGYEFTTDQLTDFIVGGITK